MAIRSLTKVKQVEMREDEQQKKIKNIILGFQYDKKRGRISSFPTFLLPQDKLDELYKKYLEEYSAKLYTIYQNQLYPTTNQANTMIILQNEQGPKRLPILYNNDTTNIPNNEKLPYSKNLQGSIIDYNPTIHTQLYASNAYDDIPTFQQYLLQYYNKKDIKDILLPQMIDNLYTNIRNKYINKRLRYINDKEIIKCMEEMVGKDIPMYTKFFPTLDHIFASTWLLPSYLHESTILRSVKEQYNQCTLFRLRNSPTLLQLREQFTRKIYSKDMLDILYSPSQKIFQDYKMQQCFVLIKPLSSLSSLQVPTSNLSSYTKILSLLSKKVVPQVSANIIDKVNDTRTKVTDISMHVKDTTTVDTKDTTINDVTTDIKQPNIKQNICSNNINMIQLYKNIHNRTFCTGQRMQQMAPLAICGLTNRSAQLLQSAAMMFQVRSQRTIPQPDSIEEILWNEAQIPLNDDIHIWKEFHTLSYTDETSLNTYTKANTSKYRGRSRIRHRSTTDIIDTPTITTTAAVKMKFDNDIDSTTIPNDIIDDTPRPYDCQICVSCERQEVWQTLQAALKIIAYQNVLEQNQKKQHNTGIHNDILTEEILPSDSDTIKDDGSDDNDSSDDDNNDGDESDESSEKLLNNLLQYLNTKDDNEQDSWIELQQNSFNSYDTLYFLNILLKSIDNNNVKMKEEIVQEKDSIVSSILKKDKEIYENHPYYKQNSIQNNPNIYNNKDINITSLSPKYIQTPTIRLFSMIDVYTMPYIWLPDTTSYALYHDIEPLNISSFLSKDSKIIRNSLIELNDTNDIALQVSLQEVHSVSYDSDKVFTLSSSSSLSPTTTTTTTAVTNKIDINIQSMIALLSCTERYGIPQNSISQEFYLRKLIQGNTNWNLLWTWRHTNIDQTKLVIFQKINHFRNSIYLTRKDQLLRSIVHYSKSLPSPLNDIFYIIPKAYTLPYDSKSFIIYFLRKELQYDDKNVQLSQVYNLLIENDCNITATKNYLMQHFYTDNCTNDTANANIPQRGHPKNLWIVKPTNSSRGRGIMVTSDLTSITTRGRVIVQEYISNPYLLYNRKFDFRLYVLVTSFEPLEAFLYTEGLARFAMKPYSTDPNTLNDLYIHLTNSSINQSYRSSSNTNDDNDDVSTNTNMNTTNIKNEFKENYINKQKSHTDNRPFDTSQADTKILFTDCLRLLEHDGVDIRKLLEKIDSVIIKTQMCVKSKIGIQLNAFELFGFDIMIDENLNAWLIEVNASPSLNLNTHLDRMLKPKMIADVIQIVDPIPYDREYLSYLTWYYLKYNTWPKVNTKNYNNTQYDIEYHYKRLLHGRIPRLYGQMPSKIGLFRRIAPGKQGSVFFSQQLQNLLLNIKIRKSPRINFIRKYTDNTSKNMSTTRKFYKAVTTSKNNTTSISTPTSDDTLSTTIESAPASAPAQSSPHWKQSSNDMHDDLGCIVQQNLSFSPLNTRNTQDQQNVDIYLTRLRLFG